MSLLNVNISVLCYNDGPASTNPSIRLADLKWSMLGLPTDSFKNTAISLAPGESMTVASTARSITYSSTDSFTVTKIGSDRMRMAGTFGQRTSRNVGDATTGFSIQKIGSIVRLQYNGTGLSPVFSAIVPGDTLRVTGFSTFNCGEFLIMSKGSDYVDFFSPYAVDEAGVIGSPLTIYSSGPVQKGDILDITAPQFSFPNQGSFPIVEVNDSYIEVINPNAFDQVVTSVSTGISIYPYAYKWMMIACDRKIRVGLNGQGPTGIEVEPAVEGDLNKQPGIFLKRGKVFEVQIMNSGLQQVQGFLILAE